MVVHWRIYEEIWFWVCSLCALIFLASCNSHGSSAQNVADPPEFISMYLDRSTSPIVPSDAHRRGAFNPKYAEDVDEAIYSESDFAVIVTTNGQNYDLLYSVEVVDSLLGTCIYTDQSLLYKANSTIIVESDSTYTTEVSLTVPGSTEHDSYLSTRTITLTKILFSRDTVSGTFPADIPSNSDTLLTFEVHAINYTSADFGYPVHLENGKINLSFKPGDALYDIAAMLNKTTWEIPNTINDYPIGSIYLEDIDWITSLTIAGASNDVFILGDFAALTTLSISGFNHEVIPTAPVYKHLTINHDAPLLTTVTITDCVGYSVYLGENTETQNSNYLAYKTAASTNLYNFENMTSLTINTSSLSTLKLGADSHNETFSALTDVTITSCHIGYLEFGNEGNYFDALENISASLSLFGTAKFYGSKNVVEDAATLSLDNGAYGYMEIKGSVFDKIETDTVTFSGLIIRGGFAHPSRLTELIMSDVGINGIGGNFHLIGNHPSLTTIALTNIDCGELIIGSTENEFPNLTSISFDYISGNSISVGDRDTLFSKLAILSLNHITLTGNIRIGYETAEYPLLTTLTVSYIAAANFFFGRGGEVCTLLEEISFENVALTGDLTIAGVILPALDTIYFTNVAIASLNLSTVNAHYHAFIDNLTLTSYLNINSDCVGIYVTELDPTTWPYYDVATALSISVATMP